VTRVEIDDVCRVTAEMNSSLEGDVMNVFWVKQASSYAYDQDFMEDAALALDTAFDHVVPYMPDTFDFIQVSGYNLTQDIPLPTVSWPTQTSGEVDVAHPLPAPCSLLALMRTGQPRSVGRKYFAPFTEDNQVDATWTSAIPASCLNLLDVLLTPWSSGAGNAKIGVWSEKLLTWLPIIETVASNIVSYQRRRRKGTGS